MDDLYDPNINIRENILFFPAHQLTAISVIITLPPTKGALQRKMLVYVCNILLSPQTTNIINILTLLEILLSIAELLQLSAQKDMLLKQV